MAGYRKGAGAQKNSDNPAVDDVFRSEDVFINFVPAVTYTAPQASEGGVLVPIDTYIYDQEHAQPLLDVAGLNAPFDDINAFDGGTFDGAAVYPNADGSLQPQAPGIPTDEPLPPGRVPTGISVECGNFITSPIDYDQNVSPNYTIRNFSVGAVFPHPIRAQNNLSVQDILCNLQALAINIVEPLRAEYPGFNINSGFRVGQSTSQHGRGQGVDVQWPGKPAADYNEIAVWCIANLPFDQFIFEHGKSIWIHMSYNRGLTRQRNQILTFYQGVFKSGLRNYYAPSAPWPQPPPPEENGNENGNSTP